MWPPLLQPQWLVRPKWGRTNPHAEITRETQTLIRSAIIKCHPNNWQQASQSIKNRRLGGASKSIDTLRQGSKLVFQDIGLEYRHCKRWKIQYQCQGKDRRIRKRWSHPRLQTQVSIILYLSRVYTGDSTGGLFLACGSCISWLRPRDPMSVLRLL